MLQGTLLHPGRRFYCSFHFIWLKQYIERNKAWNSGDEYFMFWWLSHCGQYGHELYTSSLFYKTTRVLKRSRPENTGWNRKTSLQSFPAGLPSERAKPRLKQLLQDLKITYYRVIIHGGTNDLKKYEENSSFDFYDVLSIFNALVKLHNVSHTFRARSVAVSIPEVECEISETCPNFKKARNKINEPLQSFVARNKRYMVPTDFVNEIMYRSRDQNLWSGPVHFLPAVFRSRLEQKSPVTECLVCCVFVLFSMKESMIRIDSWFVSIAMTFYFLALSAARVPLGQCSGVSLL